MIFKSSGSNGLAPPKIKYFNFHDFCEFLTINSISFCFSGFIFNMLLVILLIYLKNQNIDRENNHWISFCTSFWQKSKQIILLILVLKWFEFLDKICWLEVFALFSKLPYPVGKSSTIDEFFLRWFCGSVVSYSISISIRVLDHSRTFYRNS